MKTCTRCNRELSLEEFNTFRGKKTSRCSECLSELGEIKRRWYAGGGNVRQQEWLERMRKEQPFKWKARMLSRRLGWTITEQQLRGLWEAQGGICPLTLTAMDLFDSQIDHIIPKSRGGANDISNLRWLSSKANYAKGEMLDEEFLRLCNSVVRMAEAT